MSSRRSWTITMVLVLGVALVVGAAFMGIRARDQRRAERATQALSEVVARQQSLERCVLGQPWPREPGDDATVSLRIGRHERSVDYVMNWLCARRASDVAEMAERLDPGTGNQVRDRVRAVLDGMPQSPGRGIARWQNVASAMLDLHETVRSAARAAGLEFGDGPALVAPTERIHFRGLGASRRGLDPTVFFQRIRNDRPTGTLMICRGRNNGTVSRCRSGEFVRDGEVGDVQVLTHGSRSPAVYLERADGTAVVVDEDAQSTTIEPVEGDAVLATAEAVFTLVPDAEHDALTVSRTPNTAGAAQRELVTTLARGRRPAALASVLSNPYAIWLSGEPRAEVRATSLRPPFVTTRVATVDLGSGGQRPTMSVCRTQSGAAVAMLSTTSGVVLLRGDLQASPATAAAHHAGTAATPAAAPSAPLAIVWREIARQTGAVVHPVLRCGSRGSVIVFEDGSALRSRRCDSDRCEAPVALGERPSAPPDFEADDEALLIVHTGDLVAGRELAGRIARLGGAVGAPFWRLPLDDDRTRGVVGVVLGRTAVVYMASGRDDTIEAWHGDVGATELQRGEVRIEGTDP